ncbi:magnesium and cobalt transport protein CorA [Propionibacteriaceae bacterium Y1923]|uniref:magnesium and cobalt transport protein CorA n=1 Tax=Aestuariimicrobium sp. Y1814 TaxID=3418742 RepID=UPI003C138810
MVVRKAPTHQAVNRRLPQWETTPDSVVAWGWYVEGVRQDTDDLQHATDRAQVGDGFVWLGLKDPTNEDMTHFATQFHLHPLAIEDAVEGHTRSKLEFFDDTVFAVLSTVAYLEHANVDEAAEVVSTGQIMVFLGPNFIMTVRRGEQSPLRTMRHELEQRPEFLADGPHVVLYSVFDRVVDDYLQVVAEIEEDLDEVEEQLFEPTSNPDLSKVYQLKREVIEFRRSMAPLSLPLTLLASRDIPLVPADARAYFREVSDHHTEAREAVASFDEVLTNLLQAGLARLSVKDNQDMRKISAAVAILAVPTLVGAIYGMNFTYMPELDYHWGYFITLGAMALIMAVLAVLFRRNKWL